MAQHPVIIGRKTLKTNKYAELAAVDISEFSQAVVYGGISLREDEEVRQFIWQHTRASEVTLSLPLRFRIRHASYYCHHDAAAATAALGEHYYTQLNKWR